MHKHLSKAHKGHHHSNHSSVPTKNLTQCYAYSSDGKTVDFLITLENIAHEHLSEPTLLGFIKQAIEQKNPTINDSNMKAAISIMSNTPHKEAADMLSQVFYTRYTSVGSRKVVDFLTTFLNMITHNVSQNGLLKFIDEQKSNPTIDSVSLTNLQSELDTLPFAKKHTYEEVFNRLKELSDELLTKGKKS